MGLVFSGLRRAWFWTTIERERAPTSVSLRRKERTEHMRMRKCTREGLNGFAVSGWRHSAAVAWAGALLLVAGGCASAQYVSAPGDAPDAAICTECAGKGKVEDVCRVCKGQGYTTMSVPGLGTPSYTSAPCKACVRAEALGTPKWLTCPRCKGTGRVYRCDSSGRRLPADSGL